MTSSNPIAEKKACTPLPLADAGFNMNALLPHGVTVHHVKSAMQEFIEFLGYVNNELNSRDITRLEAFLMSANFSSIVGEFMTSTIPKYCNSIVKNSYHNGHPDMVPAGRYVNDAAQHEEEGIEVKGSRYLTGWQGHNPEDCFLMVFVFDANTARDAALGKEPKSFRFVKVVAAKLEKSDWTFAGRKEGSRRTITASVNKAGFDKMEANWIYKAPVDHEPKAVHLAEPNDPDEVDLA